MRGSDFLRQVAYRTGCPGILQQQRKRVGGADGAEIARRDRGQGQTQRLGSRGEDGKRLRMEVCSDRQDIGSGLARCVRHGHRLRGGGGLVEQGRVGDLHACQLADHRLEVQQRFQPALCDFSLVGRVGRVPAWIFQHVAQDHRRREGAVIAHSDQAFRRRVLRRQGAQFGYHRGLIDGWRQVQRGIGTDRRGDRLPRDVVEGRGADDVQHRSQFGLGRSDMAANEAVALLQFRQFSQGIHAYFGQHIHAYKVSKNSS